MKKLLKEYRYLLIILAIPYLFIIVGSLVKVKYDLTAPASITQVSDNITIKQSNRTNVNSVSVYSYSRISLLSYLFGKINPYATIDKTYEYQITNNQIEYHSGLIQKEVSIYNAIISGYIEAGYDEIVNSESFKGYIIHTLYKYSPKQLKIGDIITEFNGTKFTKSLNKNEFSEICKNLSYEKDKEYSIKVIRNNEILEFNIAPNATNAEGTKPAFGINTYAYNIPTIFSSDSSIYYKWNYGNSIGPSAGLMQSLYVYESLNGQKLTKNLKIVGTGTVDVYGNAGAIGGIYQKVITANLSGADIFFVPVSTMDASKYQNEENYQEAFAAYEKIKNPKMKLVPVASLKDIIEYLNNIKE